MEKQTDILTAVYTYRHSTTTKTRWNLVETKGLPNAALDGLTDKSGNRFVYLTLPNRVKAIHGRKPALRLCGKKHFTSLFLHDIGKNLYFGDKGETALIVQVNGEAMKILVCEGQKQNCNGICELFLANELGPEERELLSTWNVADTLQK